MLTFCLIKIKFDFLFVKRTVHASVDYDKLKKAECSFESFVVDRNFSIESLALPFEKVDEGCQDASIYLKNTNSLPSLSLLAIPVNLVLVLVIFASVYKHFKSNLINF